MKTNIAPDYRRFTHEGGPASCHLSPIEQLRRTILSCMLWEDQFYEDGQSIADRIKQYIPECIPLDVAYLAIQARNDQKLRHVPLLLAAILASDKKHINESVYAIHHIIQRADEMGEFLSIYAQIIDKPSNNIKKFIPYKIKKALSQIFCKFDAYQLAKYNRPAAITLRDVMFLTHPRPKSKEQEITFNKLANKKLESPDTWEVSLSGGKDKKETFTRMLKEGKLGYLALLRNLRNMVESGVENGLIIAALLARKGADKVFPFRFVAAYRACPSMSIALNESLLQSLNELPKLPGKTIVLIDVSASMENALSSKSDMTRMDAAAALGSLIQGDEIRVFTFSQGLYEVSNFRGLPGIDSILTSQPHGGTYLGMAINYINKNYSYDRIVVITDEQSSDVVPAPLSKFSYMINVASYQNGIGYGKWVHIDGFSENVLRWIHEYEGMDVRVVKGDRL